LPVTGTISRLEGGAVAAGDALCARGVRVASLKPMWRASRAAPSECASPPTQAREHRAARRVSKRVARCSGAARGTPHSEVNSGPWPRPCAPAGVRQGWADRPGLAPRGAHVGSRPLGLVCRAFSVNNVDHHASAALRGRQRIEALSNRGADPAHRLVRERSIPAESGPVAWR
jgi:hypothetical protein